ncbi:MAG: ABC transporter substrate-binding protein, partial [Pseudomonadota bacterium]
MKKRNLLMSRSVMVLILIFLVSTPLYAENVRGVTDDTMKIGVIIDLSGPFTGATVPIKEAIAVHFKHINEMGGIHGRKVKLIIEDDRYSIPLAIAAFKKLVYKDEIFATFGPSQTGASVALSSKIEKQGLVTFPCSHSERMVTPHKRHIFMPGASYADQVN